MKNPITLCLFFILFFGNSFTAIAQCGAGGLTFSNQASIDNFTINFPGCTQIIGNAIISGADITNLNGLSVVTSVGGHLIIQNNPILASVSGLSSLTTVGGYLIVHNNTVLTSLTGLSSCTSASLVQIDQNAALLNLSGLSALSSVSILDINNNPALTSLSGLTALTSLSNFYINNNASLASLAALSGITTVSGVLIIRSNAILANLSGLSSLSTVGALTIDDNIALTSVAGLTALTNVAGGLSVQNNDALPDLSGFSGLTAIGNYLNISDNLNLTNVSGLSGVTFNLWQYLRIDNNAVLVNLNGLSGVPSVGQQIEIRNNASLTSIAGLLGVLSIGSYLNIQNNDVLPSLYGVDNINPASITNLFLQNSNILSYCEVPSICSYLSIPANPATIDGNATNCGTRLAVETACLALPIEMISFSGTQLGNQIMLHWTTATEINNDYFVIERSANGVSFEKIGVVKGANNSHLLLKYEYMDRNPSKGINYYRLKQVDTDGIFAFSSIIAIQNTRSKTISLYPNPAHNELYVTELLQNSSYTIENMYGQVVQTGVLTPTEAIQITPLTQGLYYIYFDNQALKFVKQ